MSRKVVVASLLIAVTCSSGFCQDGIPPVDLKLDKTLVADTELMDEVQEQARNALYAKFTKLMTGAKMTGQYTVDGAPLSDLKEESYEIEKVEKQPEGDLWVITARIKYGKRDLTVPVPIDVKWAGSTPVLTLDDLTLPGFGTFSARVVFHKDKYAGTWTHGDVGGHMFGKVEIKSDATKADPTKADPTKADNEE